MKCYDYFFIRRRFSLNYICEYLFLFDCWLLTEESSLYFIRPCNEGVMKIMELRMVATKVWGGIFWGHFPFLVKFPNNTLGYGVFASVKNLMGVSAGDAYLRGGLTRGTFTLVEFYVLFTLRYIKSGIKMIFMFLISSSAFS